MAVVGIAQIWPRRGESEGPDASSATRRWRIQTDNRYDTEHIVYAAGVLPNRHDPLPENGFLTARRIRLEQRSDTPYFWEATVEYSSAPMDREEQEKEDFPDPLDRPAIRRWGTVQYREAVEKDRFGNAVVNTAGDLYDPPPERDVSNWTVTITKNVASVPDFVIDYQNTVNDDDITIGGLSVAAGQAKMQSIEIGEEITESGSTYYQFSYTLEIKWAGWQLELLQQGLRQVDPADDSKRIPCVDKNGDPVTSPVLLDADGEQIATPLTTAAVYVEHEIYWREDFSKLPGIED